MCCCASYSDVGLTADVPMFEQRVGSIALTDGLCEVMWSSNPRFREHDNTPKGGNPRHTKTSTCCKDMPCP